MVCVLLKVVLGRAENSTRGETVVISADELLPLLVLLVIKCRIPCWLSILHYLNNYRLSEVLNPVYLAINPKDSFSVCGPVVTFLNGFSCQGP